MSKTPFWRPPQSAEVMRPMARVRVKGFPDDSPEAGALLTAFDGSLRNFYLRSAQAQSQSGLAQVRKVIDRGDHQLEYLHSSGQETVTLAVHPQKIREVLEEQKKVTPETWWDWAVVDIEFDATDTYGYFSAFMVDPYRPQLTPTYTDPIKGVAHDQYSWSYGGAFGDPPLIAFPDYGPSATRQRESGANQRASLRLDLRPFRGMPVAVFDIYGHLDTLAGETAYAQGPQVDYYQSAQFTNEILDSMVLPAGDPDPFGPGSDVNDFPTDWPSPYPSKSVPPANPQPGQVEDFWGYIAGYPSTHTRTVIESDPLPGPDIFHTLWNRVRYREYRTFWPAYEAIPYEIPPPGGQTRQATVYARTFKGDAADVYSEWSGDAYYRQWEDSRIYPERWPMPELATKLSIPAYDYPDDDTAANHFGDTKLGRVTIDLRTGGVSLGSP